MLASSRSVRAVTSDVAVELRGVTRRFGRVLALDGVSFSVRRGEIVALLGPNGAGKTTTTRIVAGVLAPTRGEAVVDGISVRSHAAVTRSRVGLVTEQPALYERMSLVDYLEFFGGLYDVPDPKARVGALVSRLDLGPVKTRPLSTFSRGMKQKAAIARALLHDPGVLLLDEPASALDPEMAGELRELIRTLRADHRAIVICTHDLDEAERLADRIIILTHGRIVREGTVDDLRKVPQASFIVEVRGRIEGLRGALERSGLRYELLDVTPSGASVRYYVAGPAGSGDRVLRSLLDSDLSVLSLAPERRSLEDAYFEAVKSSARPGRVTG